MKKTNAITIRKLKIGEEEKWLDMVASCYASKGTPRQVFNSHLERTPSSERIILAIMDEGSLFNYNLYSTYLEANCKSTKW